MDAVTGAFGYTGRYIARRLLAAGRDVRTLTGRPVEADVFPGPVEVRPLPFENLDLLTEALRDVDVLYNTYWVRFARGPITFERAVENSRRLFHAARLAGVRRVIHISITNPDPTSILPYFWGKGLVEQALRDSGLSHAILRPTVIFGREDILLNNIAWFLRRFPVFPIPGSGRYPVQPVYVDDLAALAVAQGMGDSDVLMDAVGPETFSYEEMVAAIRGAVGSRARLVHTPPGWVRLAARAAGVVLGDVVLTPDEVRGLSAGLLVSDGPPTAATSFREWLRKEGSGLGTVYASELTRHYRRP